MKNLYILNFKKNAIFVIVVLLLSNYAMAQVGMQNFMSDIGGGSGGSGGGTGVPIDGGLVAALIGSAGYAYKKLRTAKSEND